LRTLSHPRATDNATRVEPLDDGDKLAETIGNLDRRLAALELRQLAAKATELQAPDRVSGGSPPTPLDPAAMKEMALDEAAAIEATLKTEPRDRAWAPATEGQIQTAMNAAVKEGAQFSVKTLKCLTSMCELVLSASSADHLRHTSLALTQRISGMGRIDIAAPETDADGTATVTCRMFRQGYPRPDEDRH
jgi:hypothetical protein